jgi:uncharacterized repeat protein (TIGR04138 family)
LRTKPDRKKQKQRRFSEGWINYNLHFLCYLLFKISSGQLLDAELLGIMVSAPRRALFLFMQKIGFAEALDSIVASDPRYQRDAYVFLRDTLDFTTKQQKKVKGATVRHVTGPELLGGVRQYALKEFGPLVMTVFDNWGIRSCEDIGNMVFNLIGAGIFGKTEEDSIEDFKDVYDFEEAFVKPFAPEKPTGAKPPPESQPMIRK